jgi:hypothetical protein
MAGHTTHQPHGSGIRGLSSLKNIDNEDELAGKFGRMFKDLPPNNFPGAYLFTLGDPMIGADRPSGAAIGDWRDGSPYTRIRVIVWVPNQVGGSCYRFHVLQSKKS